MRGLMLMLALALSLPLAVQAEGVSEQIASVQIARLRPLDFAPFAQALTAFKPTPELEALIAGADIAALQQARAAGKVSAETLALWHLARIARLDEGLRAMLEINPAALDDARASDARAAAGRLLGPMDGIPITLKDNIGTAAPLHTTANAEVLLNNIAPADADLVTALRGQGAVILGKASLSEFAGAIAPGTPSGGNGAVGGQAVNPLGPWPTYGSSAGSAIGVAAHLTVVSVGTETSGSLVAPSAATSLVAMKPSKGLVSGAGIVPLVLNNDSAGPIARTVRDAAVLLDAIDTAQTDYTTGLSHAALVGARVGVVTAEIPEASGATELLARAGAALAMAGARMHPARLVDPTGTMDGFVVLLSSGMRFDMMPYVSARSPSLVTPEDLLAYNAADAKRRAPFGQDLIGLLAPMSQGMTAKDHAEAAAALTKAATEALEAAFAEGEGADLLLSFANFQAPYYATAGYPAITVPTGRTDTGEPSGITLIGQKGQDAQLLAYAYAFERLSRAHIEAALP